MERFCQRCRLYRTVSWTSPGSLQYCAPCLEAIAKNESTNAQIARRVRRQKSRRRRFNEVSAWADDYKSKLGCWYCGESDPSCLDGYREDSSNKEMSISKLIKKKPDLAVVQKELNACKVICSNCHCKHAQQDLNMDMETPETQVRDVQETVILDVEEEFEAVAEQQTKLGQPERPPGFDEAMAELRRTCFPDLKK